MQPFGYIIFLIKFFHIQNKKEKTTAKAVLIIGDNFMVYNFCERLKELRQEKNLSYRQLGKNTGFSDTAIRRWENGIQIPNIETLIAFAKYFNVSTDYLLGLED